MSDSISPEGEQPILSLLKRELALLTGIGVGAQLAFCMLLSAIWQESAAVQWLLQSAIIWLFICYETWRRLSLNRSEDSTPLYNNLGWGNRLTLLRSWLIGATAGFLLQPWPEGAWLSWLPGMIYFAGAVLDRVDGFVARRSGQMSRLGNELDTVSDALGLAVAAFLAVSYGQVHWSYLSMGLAYYVFQAGLYWRRFNNLPIYPLPPAMHRRAWAGFQMGYLVVALWPLFYPPITLVAGFAFMLPALSGFIIDWLIVSGRIERQADDTNQQFSSLTLFSQNVLQPCPAACHRRFTGRVSDSGRLSTGCHRRRDLAQPDPARQLWPGLRPMVLIGVAGRYFCLLLVGTLGWYYIDNPMLPVDYALLCCVVWSMLLGTGRFSLWQEDDHWLNRYDGA
jgi:CDP-diacylglycerol--glycerol-3-phosphate 3-phosphatidyltransferase